MKISRRQLMRVENLRLTGRRGMVGVGERGRLNGFLLLVLPPGVCIGIVFPSVILVVQSLSYECHIYFLYYRVRSPGQEGNLRSVVIQ